jgi:uncharacterized NAD(P)/FAD-binding protein YdhS
VASPRIGPLRADFCKSMVMDHRIAIIGAGFSGTVLAAHLLRQTPQVATSIILIERDAVMGRGAAYAVRAYPFLLNVPAGRLSADSRDPRQFLEFARRALPNVDAEEFLPRRLYGDYLEDVLLQAERAASDKMRLTRVCGEVLRMARSSLGGSAIELHLEDSEPILADQVVLALGNPSSGHAAWAHPIRDHAAYRADPWSLPTNIGPDKTVVIIGNGLTMVDVAVSLAADLERAPKIVTISRHGLTPLPQSQFHAAAPHGNLEAALAGVSSIRQLLSIVREFSGEAAKGGGDWREVITSVRNVAPRLWQRLSHAERSRFLRHVRSYWDVHRHRIPPELAARLDLIRRAGRIEINAGRIVAVESREQGLAVRWRKRGSESVNALAADLVVKATGPEASLKRTPDSLLRSLREGGWIVEDELALGLRTGPNGACVDSKGQVSERLFYLGPMLRSSYWEATAATELRDHAERLAVRLLG